MHENRAPVFEPAEQGAFRGQPIRHCAFLRTLAEHSNQAPLLVEIAEV
jgi:hypothetical protein